MRETVSSSIFPTRHLCSTGMFSGLFDRTRLTVLHYEIPFHWNSPELKTALQTVSSFPDYLDVRARWRRQEEAEQRQRWKLVGFYLAIWIQMLKEKDTTCFKINSEQKPNWYTPPINYCIPVKDSYHWDFQSQERFLLRSMTWLSHSFLPYRVHCTVFQSGEYNRTEYYTGDKSE